MAAVFGTVDLVLRHTLGATSALGEATALAFIGALLFVLVYPRAAEPPRRLVAKVIPLVLFQRSGPEPPGVQGKCALPRGSHLGPVAPNAVVHTAGLGDLNRVRSRMASVRGNAPHASVRHR
ncbi:MAG: hypothetical protein WA688_00240 [Thermoplasmata archaeon]